MVIVQNAGKKFMVDRKDPAIYVVSLEWLLQFTFGVDSLDQNENSNHNIRKIKCNYAPC